MNHTRVSKMIKKFTKKVTQTQQKPKELLNLYCTLSLGDKTIIFDSNTIKGIVESGNERCFEMNGFKLGFVDGDTITARFESTDIFLLNLETLYCCTFYPCKLTYITY